MKVLRATGNVFILIGLTLLLFVGYELIGTSVVTGRHQSALADEFDASLDRPIVAPSEAPSKAPAARHYTGPHAIARIRIPVIRLSKIVVEGTSLARLAWGPGRYTSTSPIGGRGVTAIAGHRTGWGSPFINVDRVGRGDDVFLDTPKGTYRYRITSTRIVKPTETWVLGGDPNSDSTHRLTLTTCTPKYTSRNRLILWGDLVETIPRA